MNPTKAEKAYWDKIASIGCIACLKSGIINTQVSVHHCDGRTKPGAHRKVLALCFYHHQSGSAYAPSIHPWRRKFERAFGTQEDLMAETERLALL